MPLTTATCLACRPITDWKLHFEASQQKSIDFEQLVMQKKKMKKLELMFFFMNIKD